MTRTQSSKHLLRYKPDRHNFRHTLHLNRVEFAPEKAPPHSHSLDGSARAMDSAAISLLAFVGAALVFVSTCWFQCRKNRPMRLEDLRVPLMPADAEAGFRRCALCGFESFKRFPFCSICGEKLDDADQKFVYFLQAEHTQRDESKLTQRQKRARQRKEWQRKTDVEGKLYWYRQRRGSDHVAAAPRLAGYTLRFTERSSNASDAVSIELAANLPSPENLSPKTAPKVVCQVFPDENVSLQEESEDERSFHAPTHLQPTSKDAILHQLKHQVNSASHVLSGSWLSDPAAFAIHPASDQESTQKFHDSFRMAAADFPTKFAHFVVTTVGLMVPAAKELITLNIRRESLLADSVEALSVIPQEHVRSSFRVSFVGERGVDAGGIYREWSVLLNQCLADANTGVFRCVDVHEQIFYLNSNSVHDIGVDHLVYFFATGRQVGRALLSGHVLGYHLALPLLKIILGLPVSFNDLEYFDPQAYQSMLWILSNDGVDALGLTFSVTEKRGGEVVEVDLVENGRNVSVTDANKEQYLQRRFQYLLFESVSSQLYVFLKGVYEVIPQELLMLFDPEEFDYVLCGSDEIDVDDWQRNTRYSGGKLHSGHELVKWFWEIVREMPNEYRRRLLHFATGSSRVPIEGFSGLTSIDGRLYRFTLKGVPLTENEYIWGHACFNQLDLPYYESREKLKLMLYATLDTDVQGFTTD